MSNPRILLLDRSTRASLGLERTLADARLAVRRAETAREAQNHLQRSSWDVVVAELGLFEDVLAAFQNTAEAPPVILLDDFATASQAALALRRRAFDTVSRPASDEEVLGTVRRALEQRQLEAENRRLRRAIGERFELGALVSRDARMARIFETVEAVADSRATLLLQGESGTGKTVLARAIHERSQRSGKPFVVVNCGAIPTPLLESELFGHARGAFTGAVRDRRGKFEAAEGGTLFLDEIGTASGDLQVKLLRVLEEGRLERVGESRTRTVDVRVIAATNAVLSDEVRAGRFRADLFYRLNVVGIELPPLRERTADVAVLAERFLVRFAREHERPVEGFEPAAFSRLCAHPWPGNVRELENALERAVLLSRGPRLRVEDLWPGEPASEAAADPSAPWGELPLGPLKEALELPERWLILRALRHHDWRRQETARALGINRTTLFNKMKKYDIRDPLEAPESSDGDPPSLKRAG